MGQLLRCASQLPLTCGVKHMKVAITFIILFLISCRSLAEDFSLNGIANQIISLGETKLIQLHCYCSNNIEIIRDDTKVILLEIEANLSSVGYHGKQIIPDEIAESLLHFDAEDNGYSLLVSSQEYTQLHHSFIIKSLKIHAPSGVRIQLMPIKYNMLEGR